MTTWNDRLTRALEASPMNKSAFAKAVGVSAPTVTDWVRGGIKELTADNARKVCKVLNLNMTWLLTGRGPMRPGGIVAVDENIDAPDDLVKIPVKKVGLRATNDTASGFAIHFEEDETVKPMYYRKDWLEENGYRADALIARQVRGSSMEPALYDGDKVLINLDSKTPKNGVAFAVFIDGQPCIKRLKRMGGVWMITSDNPAHAKTDCPLENLDQIIGEAVEKSSRNI